MAKHKNLSLENVYDIALRNEGYFGVCMYSYSKESLRKMLRKEYKKEGSIISFKGRVNGEFLYKVDLKALKAKKAVEKSERQKIIGERGPNISGRSSSVSSEMLAKIL